jgi:hypothetical protein
MDKFLTPGLPSHAFGGGYSFGTGVIDMYFGDDDFGNLCDLFFELATDKPDGMCARSFEERRGFRELEGRLEALVPVVKGGRCGGGSGDYGCW